MKKTFKKYQYFLDSPNFYKIVQGFDYLQKSHVHWPPAFLYPLFSLEKRVYLIRTKVGLSSVCLSVHASATFLVNTSPKLLGLTTSNFADANVYMMKGVLGNIKGQIMDFLVNASPPYLLNL